MGRRALVAYRRPSPRVGYGVRWSYAERDGGLVLRDQTSWRKINGVWINTPWGQAWILFRRRPWL